ALDALECIAKWWAVYRAHPEAIILGSGLGSVAEAKRPGRVAVFLGFQHPDALEGRLYMVDVFYKLGVRFFQLTYQHKNLIGDGCGERTDCGLSKFGIRLVERLNDVGMVIDLSHVGIQTTLDAIEHSRHPVVITHTAARALCDTPRNKTDTEIRACAERGGVICIGPKSGFLRSDGLARGTTLDDYIAHIDYVRDLVGIEHVGIGTDVGDERKYTKEKMAEFNVRYPEVAIIDSTLRVDLMHTEGLQSPRTLYNVVAALVDHGYSDHDIRAVIGGNVMRVLEQVWQ
ncbi:MAG: membrane dipeptidase, partial [Candidatus Bipolaricaulis sp.]|nr:membrane dipeptidase [Candidatus Bipolaricaulis sp.]